MTEPPRLPPNDEDPPQPDSGQPRGPEASMAGNSAAANPFEPVRPALQSAPGGYGVPRTDLPPEYWGVWFLAMVMAGGLCFVVPGWGVPTLLALILAAVRVPLLQRRLTWSKPDRPLPKPLWLLATSWMFMMICGVASAIAFAAICIPTGWLTITAVNGDMENAAIVFVLAFSGLAGLAAFIFLFAMSLRLPA